MIDASGEAKGIAVDPHDNRLYVAEGDHVAQYGAGGSFEEDILAGEVTEAVGIAAYSYTYAISKTNTGELLGEDGTRYLFVAAARGPEPDAVKVFSGSFKWRRSVGHTVFGPLKLRRTITAVDQDRNPETAAQQISFGAAGAQLAADPGNRDGEEKCASVAEQACTEGHLLLYDAGHEVVDELDATGEFLDQLTDSELEDVEPSALAVDRSGGPGDGTIYLGSGAGAGAKLLAFGPLPAPSRSEVPALSQVLANAQAIAVDDHGDVYAAAGPSIHVYDSSGKALSQFEDAHTPLQDLAVDSEGNLYVLEEEEQVAYYSPSSYPPTPSTAYTRRGPVAERSEFPGVEPAGEKPL
jgi:hypothetical protein